MHEMALAEGMLEIVEATARKNGAQRVLAVRLEIGALASVEADALRFCFDAVTRGSLAERARLEIETTPGAAWCMACAQTVAIPALGAPCPYCASYQLAVSQGDAMRVKDIEIA
jgi:hydrogenase nickel incorporation protein HypA/HybF